MTPAELLRRIRGKKSLKDMFLYIPFSNYKGDHVVKNKAAWLRQTGLQFKVIEKGWRSLTRVGDEALLMVAGHGDEGNTTISVQQKGEWKDLTANDLAEQIEGAGLSKKHQSILLLTCWGGGKSDFAIPGVTPGADRMVSASLVNVRDNSVGNCLAATVAQALGSRGYNSILVGGFPGAFGPNDQGVGSVFDTSADEPVLAQLDHIQWFDARGNAA